MLLETLDIKNDDIVIYSQNLFNHDKNFRIVFKDDINKESRKISYSEVCRYVNEYTPKNLIVYRLLTNVKDFEIYVPKYGFFLNINGIAEMIFFDPVYAVRELEEYSKSIDYKQLRFRIQQVGLTTLNRKDDLPNFAEIYCIDLEATEAKFQSDKVFADAIFSTSKALKSKDNNPDFINKLAAKKPVHEIGKPAEAINRPLKDDRKINDVVPGGKLNENKEVDKKTARHVNNDETKLSEFLKHERIQSEKQHSVVKIERDVKPEKKETIPGKAINVQPDREVTQDNRSANSITAAGDHVEGIRIVRHDISEDKHFDYKEIMKINFKGAAGLEDKKLSPGLTTQRQNILLQNEPKEITNILNKNEEKVQSPFGKFLNSSKSNTNDKKVTRQSGDEKVSKVLDMFKSSASANEYVKDRAGKQIVLKLDNK